MKAGEGDLLGLCRALLTPYVSSPLVGRGTARSVVEGLLKSHGRLWRLEEPLRHGAKARRATSPRSREETMAYPPSITLAAKSAWPNPLV